jgi:hypothetical protein
MSNNNLDFDGLLPLDAFKKEGGKMRLHGGGGQAPAPTNTSTSQTTIPEYAKPYMERLLGKTEALTDISQNPYKMYQGGDPNARVAAFDPMQTQSFSNISGMTPSAQLGMGTGMATAGGVGSLMAGQNYQNMATDPNSMAAYMNPYMKNVVQYQQDQNARNYGIQLQGQQAQAVGQRAFGGNRQALAQSEGTRNLGFTQAQTAAQGSQAAYDAARQAQQFGTTAGLQGYQQGIGASNTLGQLGQTQFGQQMGINNALATAGATQQARQQELQNVGYENYQNQMNAPYKQIGFMSDLLHGGPLSQTATTEYGAAPSLVSQAAGLGLAGLGVANALGKS